MKSIWKGSIGFGLVNIPVKLYSAVQTHDIDLDMLDSKDHSQVKYKRVNEKSGKEVPWENIVKGYLLNDNYVILDDKDFEAASPEQTKTIAIQQFVQLEDIDPIYFESSYFLEPEKSGVRAYALLVQALTKTGKAGITTFILRQKESLAVLRVYQDALLLTKMRFGDEVRGISDLAIPSTTGVKAEELKMALSLIKEFSGEFKIDAFKDTYNEKLLKLIQQKAKGKAPKTPKMELVHTTTTDLMSQLKASLSNKAKAK